MSKMKMFAVYDSKVEAYMTPFFMRSRGEALRAWETTVNDEKSSMHRYPSDYTLFEIGEYDELCGIATSHASKVSLGLALEFKKHSDLRSIPTDILTKSKPVNTSKESIQ